MKYAYYRAGSNFMLWHLSFMYKVITSTCIISYRDSGLMGQANNIESDMATGFSLKYNSDIYFENAKSDEGP